MRKLVSTFALNWKFKVFKTIFGNSKQTLSKIVNDLPMGLQKVVPKPIFK